MSHRTFDDPHGTSDKARQGLLDNRCEHKPKRHRTIGRRKRLSAAKRARIKHHLAVTAARVKRFKAAARAYWAGEADSHP